MNMSSRLAFAALMGIGVGAFGVEALRAQSRPPAFLVAEFEVIDPAGWKAYSDGVRTLAGSGAFLVRAAKGTSLAGEPARTITIVQFASVEDAVAFDSAPAYVALKPVRDKSAHWRSYVVEGLGKP